MEQQRIIVADESEIYLYGIENGFFILLNIFWGIIVAYLFDELVSVSLFILIFITLRTYAGGYHCSKRVYCYLLSNTIIFIPIFIKLIPNKLSASIITVCMVVVFIVSPLEHINKKLEAYEVYRYKKYVYRIGVISFFLIVGGYIFKFYKLYSSIGLAIITVCGLQVCQVIKSYSNKKMKNCNEIQI